MSGIPDTPWPEANNRPEPTDQPALELSSTTQELATQAIPVPQAEPPSLAATPSESFFDSYRSRSPQARFPNFLDVFVLSLVLIFAWICSAAVSGAALHFHLWGVTTAKQAVNDIHYTLGTQVVWYLIAFVGCLVLFPAIWHTRYFSGLEWNGRAAFRKRWRLFAAAFACFVLAVVDGVLLPGPPDTPIDQVFRLPGAAWLLFGFGVTLAPFFEEMAFRGFLLPAFNTAADWAAQRLLHLPAPQPGLEGKPSWSVGAMIVGSVLTSIPFALMHAEQTGYSIGPFLLLVCVSLVLCWVRLSTRSLAACTLVHSSYNLLLFTLMLLGTGGFRHLDRM